MTDTLICSTPGRICLFGEHQDYLGLPIIAAAISRRIRMSATAIPEPEFRFSLPDIGETLSIPFDGRPMAYTHSRDYYRSAVNVLLREGYTWSRGIAAGVRSTIPINSGTSSSSALLITWLNVLTHLADKPQSLPPERLAELAYVAEVLEFGDPGGMMDHYSTAVGDVIYLESKPAIRLEKMRPALGNFVLGDSLEPKDTIGILARVKFGMLDISKQLTKVNPAFSLENTELTEVGEFKDFLTKDQLLLLKGTLGNRDLLREALTLLQTPTLDHARFGQLLSAHHDNLRDAQQISTPKIERMLEAALTAGALGGKINGSGGGGCMFAYAPDHAEAVAEAIEREGGKAYVVRVEEGTRME